MHYSFKPLREQVIVITGASSGIGLATAQAAVAQGARVVLAARDTLALEDVVRELNRPGPGDRAIAVTADVGVRADLEKVANTAIERFGGFDTWVNNAGVSIYGKLEEISEEDFRRMFDTNFWGIVHGSLVAVRHLRPRGGALINLGSVASDIVIAMQGMYCASKHAVKGFTDALRMELEMDRAPVSVTLVKPGAIDTPYPQHAKNYMDQEPKHAPPVYAPEEVARAILFAATNHKRDIYVGSSARAMSAMNRVAPQAMDRIAGSRMMVREQQRAERPRNPEGGLHQPGYGGEVRGDQPGWVMRRSFYTRGSMHPVATGVLLAAAGVTAYALIQNSRLPRGNGGERLARRARRLAGLD